jgi:hypothetical protein
MPLPFAYESTGTFAQFTSILDPNAGNKEVFAFHRPEELIRLAQLGTDQFRARLRPMPLLDPSKLWAKQITAIANLEQSLADNRPRSLIQMATGSGKTFTACNIACRLIKFAHAKRVLFLVAPSIERSPPIAPDHCGPAAAIQSPPHYPWDGKENIPERFHSADPEVESTALAFRFPRQSPSC